MSSNIIKFISNKTKQMGQGLVYTALLLYYAYNREDTPACARRIILGAFAYLLAPIDGIPDLTPFLGFTDDLSILSFSLVTIACYINEEVRVLARAKLSTWFKCEDEQLLDQIDKKL